jgi:hypothetical protein
MTNSSLIQDISTPTQAINQITSVLKGFPQLLRSLKNDVLIMPNGLYFLDDAFAEIASLLFDPIDTVRVQGALGSNFNIQEQELAKCVKSARPLACKH